MRNPVPRTFICIVILTVAAFSVGAQDQIVFDDALENGWQSYGWATLSFTNATPVHSGSASISVTDNTSTDQALYLHHDAFDSTQYQSLTFWIDGGTGGQTLRVQGVLSGNAVSPGVALAVLPANSWRQIAISLSDLGIANQATFDGFWIQNVSGAPAPTFYVDDIALRAAPPPAQVQVAIDAGATIRTLDERMYGVNLAIWDSLLTGAANPGLLSSAGARVVRFPGGSASDDYDWQTDRTVSTGGPFQWANNAATFATVAEGSGVQAYVTVNYGSGTPEQAAAWVAYYNGDPTNPAALGTDAKGRDWQTVGYWAALRAVGALPNDDGFNFLRIAHPAPFNVRYWEVGNECYGSWEYDQHGTAGSGLSGAPHDPGTYAAWFQSYFNHMLAVDPTIRIGAVYDPGFVAGLQKQGVVPHFVIFHRYPQNAGGECDATLLAAADGIATDAATVRNTVNTNFGPAGPGVELAMTELNSTSDSVGKQTVSLVNGLFMADSLGFLARSEFNACLWWAWRNGTTTGRNNAATLYGWRQFGDYGLVASGDRGDTPGNTPYPTFYAAKLLTHWGRGGDRVVSAASNYALLSAHAALLANGSLAVLAINRSPDTDQSVQIALTHFTPGSGPAAVYQYGKANDLNNADLTATSFSGAASNFNFTFPAYSMTVLVLPAQGAATPPPPPALTSGPDAQPNPATAGTPVHFTAAASGSNVLYAWTFGDGTGDTGPAPTHVYATVGEYTAIVNASDTFGGNASGSVNVSVTPPPIPLPVSALAIKLDFAAAGKDRMTLAGTLPIPKDMNFSGQIVTVAIASITQPFSLDNRGAAKSGGARFKLLAKTKKGHVTVQNAVFSANLTHGNFAAALSAYGLANATVSKQAVTIPVVVSFNGQTFTANQAQVYSAKAGAWGLTK